MYSRIFTHLRRQHYRWRAVNFDLCSALMANEQWQVFSVPHLLWHGASIYNGHLWGLMTLTPVSERLAVELSLPNFTTGMSRLGFEIQTFRIQRFLVVLQSDIQVIKFRVKRSLYDNMNCIFKKSFCWNSKF